MHKPEKERELLLLLLIENHYYSQDSWKKKKIFLRVGWENSHRFNAPT